jgi:hypothetical protein
MEGGRHSLGVYRGPGPGQTGSDQSEGQARTASGSWSGLQLLLGDNLAWSTGPANWPGQATFVERRGKLIHSQPLKPAIPQELIKNIRIDAAKAKKQKQKRVATGPPHPILKLPRHQRGWP